MLVEFDHFQLASLRGVAKHRTDRREALAEIIGATTVFTQPAPINKSVSRPTEAAPITVRFFTPLRMIMRMTAIGWLELRKPPIEIVMPSRIQLAACCSR